VKAVFGWLVLLAISVSVPYAVAETRDPMQHFFYQSFGNLPEEADAARAAGQTAILIMFVAEDCPWCAKMKANVLNQSEVQEFYRRHFRPLMMDINGDVSMTDFTGKEMPEKDFAFKHNRVRATPVFAFFGLDGKPMTRYTGATRNVEEFMWLGEFVVNGEWKNTTFPAYKRKRAGPRP